MLPCSRLLLSILTCCCRHAVVILLLSYCYHSAADCHSAVIILMSCCVSMQRWSIRLVLIQCCRNIYADVIPLLPYYCYCMLTWCCFHTTVDILLVSCCCHSAGVSHATTILLLVLMSFCYRHAFYCSTVLYWVLLLRFRFHTDVTIVLLSCCHASVILLPAGDAIILLLTWCFYHMYTLTHICVSREHTYDVHTLYPALARLSV